MLGLVVSCNTGPSRQQQCWTLSSAAMLGLPSAVMLALVVSCNAGPCQLHCFVLSWATMLNIVVSCNTGYCHQLQCWALSSAAMLDFVSCNVVSCRQLQSRCQLQCWTNVRCFLSSRRQIVCVLCFATCVVYNIQAGVPSVAWVTVETFGGKEKNYP